MAAVEYTAFAFASGATQRHRVETLEDGILSILKLGHLFACDPGLAISCTAWVDISGRVPIQN
jgi:hypothetical protein